MGIFLVLAIYLLLINFLFKNNRINETIFGALGLFLILALRSPMCGVDLLGGGSASYYGTFYEISSYSITDILRGSFITHFEIGFTIYMKLLSYLTSDFQVFLAVTAAVQIIPLSIVFYKCSPDITLSWFIFIGLGFYAFEFSGLRQGIALSISTLAMMELIKGNKKSFVIISLISFSFHYSAIVLFLAFLITNISLSLNKSVVLSLVMLAFLPLLSPFVKWISITFLAGKYLSYIDGEGVAITLFFIYLLLFYLSFYYRRKSDVVNILRWLVFIGVFFQSFGILSNNSVTRIGYYFQLYFALLLPFVPKDVRFQHMKLLVKAIAIILLCVFFVLTTPSSSFKILPYEFFWDTPIF